MHLTIRHPAPVHLSLWLRRCGRFCALAVAATVVAACLAAQKPPTHSKHHRPAHPTAKPATTNTAPSTPAAPPAPNWPVKDHPNPATVTWDSQGLRIEATNSSLEQILSDVASATGTKVVGMTADERVFGSYGPGQARDVLSQLLQGSGYNIVMIGDQGQGAPRQVVLTARQSGNQPAAVGGAAPSSNAEDAGDAEVEEPPQPAAPIPGQPGLGAPNGTPRTPQQIMQEMQLRQQQILQQQEQQRVGGNPPNQ